MVRICIVFLCALAAVHLSTAQDVKLYNGYKLIKVEPITRDHVDYLLTLQDNRVLPFKLDFWSEPFLNRSCDINVPPEATATVMDGLRKQGMVATIVQNDIQTLIENTKLSDRVVKLLVRTGLSQESAEQQVFRPSVDSEWLKSKINILLTSLKTTEQDMFSTGTQMSSIVGIFPRHAAVNTWLDELAASYPSLATTESIGKSYQSREMKLIKIGKETVGSIKPIIWVDAAIHAREWLTVGTINYIINKLLTTYDTDSIVRDLLNTYTWYFLPVVNPDGYEFTHVSDRLWRKTRSPTFWAQCPGTDPNRNFDFQWGVSGGTSTSPCTETHIGSKPFSEIETQNLRDAISRIKANVRLYIALHTYSQMWLTPWSYSTVKPVDNAEMMSVANAGEAALYAKYGTRFKVGASPDILYAASGTASDWVKGVAGVKYSYTLELRPNSAASNGFIVSESQIQPSGEEVWAALATVAQMIKTG